MTALDRAEKLTELSSIAELAVHHAAAVARLEELLDDPDVEVRGEAAAAVGSYPGERALVERVLRLAREDPESEVRRKAVSALERVLRDGDLAGAEGAGYAPELEQGEPSPELYQQVKALLFDLLDRADRPEPERRQALEALACLSQDPRVIAGIEELARSEDRGERALALRCMGKSGDRRWADAVSEGLEDDGEALLRAVRAAGEIELVASVPLLARILRSTRQSTTLRVEAAQALACLGGENVVPELLELADDADTEEEVREAAQRALSELSLLEEGAAQ